MLSYHSDSWAAYTNYTEWFYTTTTNDDNYDDDDDDDDNTRQNIPMWPHLCVCVWKYLHTKSIQVHSNNNNSGEKKKEQKTHEKY